MVQEIKNESHITVNLQFSYKCSSRMNSNVQWLCTITILNLNLTRVKSLLTGSSNNTSMLSDIFTYKDGGHCTALMHVDYFQILNQSQPFVFYPRIPFRTIHSSSFQPYRKQQWITVSNSIVVRKKIMFHYNQAKSVLLGWIILSPPQ